MYCLKIIVKISNLLLSVNLGSVKTTVTEEKKK